MTKSLLTLRDWRSALHSQGASNLMPLVRSLATTLGLIAQELPADADQATALSTHPISRLFAEQLVFLANPASVLPALTASAVPDGPNEADCELARQSASEGNLLVVMQRWSEVFERIANEVRAGTDGTDARNTHPICQHYAARVKQLTEATDYMRAYDEVEAVCRPLGYLCGGLYGELAINRRFGLVHPGSGVSLPYLRLSEEEGRQLFHLCKHHSHLYRLHRDPAKGLVLELEATGEASGAGAPNSVTLSETALEHEVERALAMALKQPEKRVAEGA